MQGIIPVGEELRKWAVIELPIQSQNQFLLTCDCPLILNDESHYNTGKEIILAPLTQKHIAIRANNVLRQDLNMTELIYFTNLLLVAIAEKYICCSNRDVLSFYKERMNNFDPIALKAKVLSLITLDNDI